MSTQALSTVTTATTQRAALGSRWVLAAAAAGLVAAGAIGGGLISHQMAAQASSGAPGTVAIAQNDKTTPPNGDGVTAKQAAAPADDAGPKRSNNSSNAQRTAHKEPVARSHKPEPVAEAPAAAPEQQAAAVCHSCGVVESVVAEKRKGEGSGVGAVAGGVIGGLIGNQMGGGNGRKAMTVLGAVGGGLAGNEVEKQQRATTVYVTRVRMQDGSLRTFTRSSSMPVGQAVTVEGNSLRIATNPT